MKIRMLLPDVDVTVGKVYNAEMDEGGNSIHFVNDAGRKRSWYYPNNPFYEVVADDAVDEPEQLTLRDQLAMAGTILFQNSDANYSFIAEELYKFADAAMEARKK